MPQWLVVTQQQVADTASYRDVMMRVWYHSTQGVSDSSNSFSTSGDHTPNLSGVSVNINVPGSGGQGASQLIHERTTRINKSYGSSTSVYAAAWLSGINYWGAGQEIYANHTYTVPARPYVAPNAPGTPSVSRNSDTSHSLSWSRNATTAGPYTSQRVQRRVYTSSGWGAWSNRANVSGTATSYTDTGTVANRVYQYRIQAVNSAGSRNSSASVLAYTTPATPSSVVASRLASDDIRVRITPNQVTPNVNFQIQHSANGGSYTTLATISGGTSAVNYTHTSPSAGDTHRYRVRAVINSSGSQGHGLVSGYRTSGTVELASPPLAPTDLHALPDMAAHPADEPVTLSWEHRPTDGSWQESFQLRHRLAGTSTWTTTAIIDTPGEIGGGGYTLPADTYATGDIVEWQVRTWGPHPNPSPYSATAQLSFAAPPTVAISAPEDGGVVEDSTLTTEWSYFHEGDSAQVTWRAVLADADDMTIETREGQGAASSVTFDTPVDDATDYMVHVRVRSALGMWSEWDTVHFSVDYLPPAPADITEVEWDRDSGTVALDIEPGAWDDVTSVEPVAVTVHRSHDGGDTWELLFRELPLGGGITALVDTTPPTRGELLYRATAISAIPSVLVGEPVAITVNETAYAYLGYGPGFSNILTFYGNLKRSTTASRDEVIQQFAGRVGANNRPAGVIISGEARSRDFGVTAALVMADGMATAEDFEEAAFTGGVMCLRTPDGVSGRRVFGKISPVGTTSEYAPIEGVQFIISETERG